MTGFRLTRLAEEDLAVIVDYVAENSDPDSAHRLLTAILEAIEALAASPGIGHVRPDLTPEPVRVWSVHSFLIVYRPAPDPIVVVRVLHGRREPGALRRDLGR